MRGSFLASLWVCLGLLTAAVSAGAAQDYPDEVADRNGTIKLQPAAPWNIEFAENRCILSRVFESERGRHVVFFDQRAPGPTFSMTVAGDYLRRFPRGTFSYFGLRNDVPMESLSVAIRGEVPDIGQAFIFPRIDLGPAVIPPEDETPDLALQARRGMEIDLEAATKVDRVIFRLGTSGLSLETGNLAAPMQALNVCALDLIRAWGLDPAEHSGHTPPHWLNQDTIIEALSDRYPDRAAIRGERGIFWVRVIVEKDGSVSQCHVDEATQTRVLETPACEEFARAQFDPARTSSGEAMRSFFTTSIFYAGDLGG